MLCCVGKGRHTYRRPVKVLADAGVDDEGADGIRITIVGLNGSSRRHLHSTRASRAEGSLGRLVCRIKLNG